MCTDVILGLLNAQHDLPPIIRIGEEAEEVTFHIGLQRRRKGSTYRSSRSDPVYPKVRSSCLSVSKATRYHRSECATRA